MKSKRERILNVLNRDLSPWTFEGDEPMAVELIAIAEEMQKGPIVTAADIAAGRLAAGRVDEKVSVEDVRVTCHKCGGVTVFPLLPNQSRRPAPCAHCGVEI